MLFNMVNHSEVPGRVLVEEVILEHDYVVAMVRQIQRFDRDDDHAREQLFEEMMQTIDANFITEARDLLPHMDRSHNKNVQTQLFIVGCDRCVGSARLFVADILDEEQRDDMNRAEPSMLT